ncbi:MAG: Gfo/Idh/MocA family oxidoreductase [Caldilineaceae bacterium]
MKPIRLGVIGLGLIWVREHKRSLAQLTDVFEIAALCDLSQDRRTQAAADFPGVPIVDSADALLALPDVDAVLVLTPIALNAPTALKALQAGKDVFMEKPIARSVAEGQALVDAAAQRGRRLFVLEQMGYRAADAVVAQHLASGVIGDVILWERVLHFEADTAQGPMSYASTPWRKQADFPLGTLFDGGIHLIAQQGQIFGPPSAVTATGRKFRPEYGEFDQVSMLFQYADGLSGMLSHSSCLPPVQNHFHVHGSQGVISVERDQLVIEIPHQEAQIIDLPADDARATMWDAIVAAYREDRTPPYDTARALMDVAILEAVDRSIKAGVRVEISRD